VHSLGNGGQVFAGQRNDPFFVDLGSIFDLGTLRPFENLHLIPSAAAAGVDGLASLSVHTIALQVPKTDVTRRHQHPTDPARADSVIGVWATASRRKVLIRGKRNGEGVESGPWVQVSRLGMPLINEVIIPMGDKDDWNAETPDGDSEFTHYYEKPELARLLPVLYPGIFPNLDALNSSGKTRADLVAILLTGVPSGVIPGFQNFTGATQADELRLNLAFPPSATPSPFGILGGDLAGFPNGRRLTDDIIAIELRAIAGATSGLVDSSFTPDGAASLLADGFQQRPASPHRVPLRRGADQWIRLRTDRFLRRWWRVTAIRCLTPTRRRCSTSAATSGRCSSSRDRNAPGRRSRCGAWTTAGTPTPPYTRATPPRDCSTPRSIRPCSPVTTSSCSIPRARPATHASRSVVAFSRATIAGESHSYCDCCPLIPGTGALGPNSRSQICR